ncbi:NifB/NifX family molybdenum-iron cluster-binding protein [Caldisericum sp.]|jgi:predicted Fe-Mo cluster-binding NifX family protein|uniref:NifB/NifX family molybdenum-iron cluster-binding protein n=1 Tax=Caldisericum sp. TaxID=2499687 RepID=UPI003D0BFFC3
MKIAFVTDEAKGLESLISEHFGHAPYFVIVEVEGDDVKNVESIANPYAGAHAHDEVVNFLKEKGVEMVVSGNMGEHMMSAFDEAGIDVVVGAEGTIDDVIDDVIAEDFEEYDEEIEEFDDEDYEDIDIEKLKQDVESLKKEIGEIKSILQDLENKLKG